MKCFVVRESCDLKNYMIGLSEEFYKECPDLICRGSYGVLAARLLGLSYGDYLRYCVSKGGTLKINENSMWVIFKNKVVAEEICKEINKEWDKFFEAFLNKKNIC